MAVFIGVVFVCLGYSGRSSGTPEARFLTWSAFPLGFAVVVFVLRITADCYYLLDPKARSIDYHYEIFSLEVLRPCLEAEDIEVVTVDGKYRSIKHVSWYEYRVVIVDRHGRTHTMSDARQEDGLERCLQQAKEISEALGVPYKECPCEHSLVVDFHHGSVEVRHVSSLERSQVKAFLMTFVYLGILTLVVTGIVLSTR